MVKMHASLLDALAKTKENYSICFYDQFHCLGLSQYIQVQIVAYSKKLTLSLVHL